MSNGKDDHHMIPISIGGPDKKSNLISLSPEIHKSIHQILEGKNYSSKVEYDRFSKKTLNNGGFITPSIVARENEKQIRYFEKYNDIITKYPELNNKYIYKIKELINELMVFIEIREGINNIENIPSFENGHIMYCDAKLVRSYLNLHIMNKGKASFIKQISSKINQMPRYIEDNLIDLLDASIPKISTETKSSKIQIINCLNISNNFVNIDDNKKIEYFDKINTNYLKYIYGQLVEIKKICKTLNSQFIYYSDIRSSNEILKSLFGNERKSFLNMSAKIENINKTTNFIYDLLEERK